ncbi:unnamed protein product [Mycena citricolor]|uniref:Uncharacterized protein n=1 Tax=Mycena citricolor TaxID=2018698 RepID=A0AAD2K1T1_9AGAR|nr:unnamed protein product [Mycena citricolor]
MMHRGSALDCCDIRQSLNWDKTRPSVAGISYSSDTPSWREEAGGGAQLLPIDSVRNSANQGSKMTT